MSAKDWLDKDYYKVLGVSKDAKPADIKKAFRKIARENHPDQHPGDQAAEQRFKEASEAHDILSDPDKRKEYDETRSLLGGGGFRFPRGGGGAPGASVEDLFRNAGPDGGLGDLLGNLFGQGAAPRRSNRPRRGSDVEGQVEISFEESVDGTTVGVQMVSDEACPACRGTGAKPGSTTRVCPSCQGSGMEAAAAGGGMFMSSQPCHECHGRGVLIDDPCDLCHGSGRARSAKTMQVRIPAGVTSGQRVRIKGKGGAGENGGEPGDLYVGVTVRPHPVFGRTGDNLTVKVPITFPEATLGAEIEVPTLAGPPVRLRIPANTPNGRTFRVRGKGVAKPRGERGDLLATVEITIPATLSDEARAALESYSALAAQPNPRTSLLAEA